MDVKYHLWLDPDDRVWELCTYRTGWAIYAFTAQSPEHVTKNLPASLRTIDGEGPNIWT